MAVNFHFSVASPQTSRGGGEDCRDIRLRISNYIGALLRLSPSLQARPHTCIHELRMGERGEALFLKMAGGENNRFPRATSIEIDGVFVKST